MCFIHASQCQYIESDMLEFYAPNGEFVHINYIYYAHLGCGEPWLIDMGLAWIYDT